MSRLVFLFLYWQSFFFRPYSAFANTWQMVLKTVSKWRDIATRKFQLLFFKLLRACIYAAMRLTRKRRKYAFGEYFSLAFCFCQRYHFFEVNFTIVGWMENVRNLNAFCKNISRKRKNTTCQNPNTYLKHRVCISNRIALLRGKKLKNFCRISYIWAHS